VVMKRKKERDFHVLETDECVSRRSSRAFVCLQAYLFVPRVSARRAAWEVTAWAVRSAISVGEATRSDETTRARIVRFGGAAEEGKEKKRKNLLVNELFVRFAASTAKTHLGLVFQPDVAVLEQPVEVVRAHGFRFTLVRVVHEVLHAAHRRDGAHDDGERREGLERLRLVSRDDGATARREGM